MTDVLLHPVNVELPSLETAIQYTVEHSDFYWFDGDAAHRVGEQTLYQTGIIYAPGYDYARLRDRQCPDENGDSAVAEKGQLQAVITAIQLAAEQGELPQDIAGLYFDKNIRMLKSGMLVEAANKVLTAPNAANSQTWCETYARLNKEVYGEFDRPVFLQLLGEEKARAMDFQPANQRAAKLKAEILERLDHIEAKNAQPLIDQELIDIYQPVIEEEYGHILGVVPDTDESVLYDTGQCVNIMNKALITGGLAQSDWEVEINPKSKIVNTNTVTRRILLPPDTTRNAHQLRKLILHEQEVHVRRAFNGAKTGFGLFEFGTASYFDNEEGLGVILEAILDSKAESAAAVGRARNRYLHVGLALAEDRDGRLPRDARQTQETTWRLEALRLASVDGKLTDEIVDEAQANSFAHIENIFRGTDFATPGHIYLKAKIYYEGLVGNIEKLREINGDKEKFRQLFLGKYNHLNEDETRVITRAAA